MRVRPPLTMTAGRHQSGLATHAVVLLYAGFATLWILFSDRAIEWLFPSPEQLLLAGTLKGLAFVVITSCLLFALLQRKSAEHAAMPKIRPGIAFAVLAIVIIVVAVASINYTIGQHKKTEALRLQNIAELKVHQLNDWLMERAADARFIQGNILFAELYERSLRIGDKASETMLENRIDALRRSHGFYGLTLFAHTGNVLRSSVNAPPVLTDEILAAVAAASTDHVMRRIGPYRGLRDNIRLDYVIPLNAMSHGSKAPVAVLHVDPTDKLFPMLQAWPGPSSSSETLLFKRDKDDVLFLNQLRHRADTAAIMRLPAKDKRLLSAQAIRGETKAGQLIEGVDYRGIPVFGVMLPVSDADWLLIVKVDRSELLAPALRSAFWITLAALLAIVVTGIAIVLLKQRQQLAISQSVQLVQREKLRALNLLATIAERTADAIFAKDLEGRYIFCNRAAELMSEAPAGGITGFDDTHIMPAEQAAKIRQIDLETIQSDTWRRYQEVLHRSDGDITIEVTKGPLYDNDGKIIGVFGISRDITQRMAAEQALRESEERFHSLFDNAAVAITVHDAETGEIIEANRRAVDQHGYEQSNGQWRRRQWPAAPYSQEDALSLIRTTAAQGRQHVEWMSLDATGQVFWEDVLLDRMPLGGIPRIIAISTNITERKVMEDALRQQANELSERNQELERFNRATVGRELDMIKLKQQVNALSAELGQPAPYPLGFLDEPETRS